MNLSPRTLQVVKNFSTINPSIQFKEGDVLKTISPTKTILAEAKLDQTFPQEFAIYDLSKFLSVISLLKEPELSFESKQVKIHSGNEKIFYTYADPSTIQVPPSKEIKMPAVDVSFTLTQESFTSVSKATSVLGVPEIAVVGDNGQILLQAFDSNNPTGDYYSLAIGETDKRFRAIFKSENLKMLPGVYNVQISRNGLSLFKGEFVEYWIAVEQSSTFEG